MNKETKQILRNQYAIMSYLIGIEQKENVLRKQINDTFELLNPKESNTEQKIKKSLEEKPQQKG